MAITRIETVDWRSSAGRVVLLGFGWTLAFGALGSTLAGAVMGIPALFLAGAFIGFTAWAVSKMIPEPVPVVPEPPRRPRSVSRRFSGHRLPR
jgi:hypothetical protein